MAQNFQQQPNDPNQQGFPPQPPYSQPQQQYMPQQAPKKPVYKKWWFWLIIVVVVVAIAGGAAGSGGNSAKEPAPVQDAATSQQDSSSEAASSNTDAAQEPASDYTIADETFVDNGYGSYSVTGTFTNTSGKEMSYVQISYRMLDEDGAQVGTAWANTNNLPDGSAWKFDAMYFDSDAAPASFQLAEVTGF